MIGKKQFVSALWDKVADYSRKVGRLGARPILTVYCVLKSEKMPSSEKLVVFTALAYVVLPIDVISAKRLPIIGWLDEIVSLSVAYRKVMKYVTPEIEREVDELLDRWFPEYTDFEEVPANG